ncbi:efflux RND transporter periplasmic adaptor subunit [bacterium]|nr:efflux RND transporter periplasmic adaptor subunit [bacterium]
MKMSLLVTIALIPFLLTLSGCDSIEEQLHAETRDETHAEHSEDHHEGHHEHRILVTSPVRKDVTSTQQYVCQIHSCQHIEVRALEGGYLEELPVKEGQAVRKGELMFKILPTLYKAKLDSEIAEAQRIQIQLTNAEALLKKSIVSPQEVALIKAELAKAKAMVDLAEAEMSFTNVTAPFDGIVDRQYEQLGSLIEEGDILTSMSDNSQMWVYFNVPEALYLDYMAGGATRDPQHPHRLTIPDANIELKLANGAMFDQSAGDTVTVEGNFNNMTGNIPFRADFLNPDGVLRHGQTGKVLVHRTLSNVVVIPQRAKFEILAKQYVFVVDENNVVHQRDITVQNELEDIFVIKDGLDTNDRIILEGIRQVRDGDRIDYEFSEPEEVLSNLKYHAE